MTKEIRAAMIDLETLSTRLDAVVVSLGFVIFDRNATEYKELFSFFTTIKFDGQLGLRHVDADTVRWWMKQSAEAREQFGVTATSPTLQAALREMADTFRMYQVEEVWSKGANFDVSILEYFWKTSSYATELWSYKAPRCFRTIQALFPDCSEKNPLAHNALEDSRNQAQELWRITQKHLLPKV